VALLVMGLAVAAYLGARGPREQHVNFVLGDLAPDVRGLTVQYVSDDDEVARDVRLAYADGAAPRVVSHEPKLADGSYRLRIDLDTRERRVSVERSVTLGGGSTQVDLSRALK
jgi:hypothetical protein